MAAVAWLAGSALPPKLGKLHCDTWKTSHPSMIAAGMIAATVDTTIEWHDFVIYGTAAGSIFPRLLFPNEDPLIGTLAAFSTYFIGFVGRQIGAAIFGHHGDRIGRKATPLPH